MEEVETTETSCGHDCECKNASAKTAFRVRYTIFSKPHNYRYHVVEERWICGSGEEKRSESFDSRKEFFLGAGFVKQITGFVPSVGHIPIRIMWIIMPQIYMKTYQSPLAWWLRENSRELRPFSFEVLRYFKEPGESIADQANRLHGRFRGYQIENEK